MPFMQNPLRLRNLMCLAAVAASGMAQGATLTWDSSGANPANPVDGAGTWDTATALWSNGLSDLVWNNAANDTAVFGNANGAAGTITLGTGITVGGLIFNAPGSGNYTLSGTTITLAGSTPTITTNVNATINSGIGGSAGLTKSGTGTLVLGGTNTYSGGTVINAGTLSFSSNSATGAGGLPNGSITLMNGATLQYTGGSGGFNRGYVLDAGTTTIASTSTVSNSGLNSSGGVSFTGSGDRTLVLSSVTGNAITFGGSIGDGLGGATSVVKSGAGDLNLNGTSNTYSGSTVVNAGKIFTNGNNRISTVSTVYINTGAEIRLNGDQIIANLQNGAGGGGQLTRAFAGTSIATIQSGSFSGRITDLASDRNIGVTKTTNGVLRLSGTNNSYTAGTTISAGTLLVNNPSGNGLGVGAVTVTSSTLGGSGFIGLTGANSISVGTAGVISAGDSAVSGGVGTLTLNGGSTTGAILNMQADSSFTFDLAAGNANDTIRFYNYTGASDFLRDGGGITLNFNGAQEGTYDLFLFYSNAGTTLTSAGFTELTSNFSLGSGLSGYNAAWDYSQTGVVSLTLTAVPEPGAMGLAIAGLAVCLVRRRRK